MHLSKLDPRGNAATKVENVSKRVLLVTFIANLQMLHVFVLNVFIQFSISLHVFIKLDTERQN